MGITGRKSPDRLNMETLMNKNIPLNLSILLRRALVLASATLVLMITPLIAAADKNILPPAFDGIWVQGSCESPTRVRLLNAFAVTDFLEIHGRQHVQIMMVEQSTAATGQQVRTMLIAPGTGTRTPLDFTIDDGRLDGTWISCPTVPAALRWGFGEGIAVLEAMGDIRRACAGPHGAACLEAIWGYMDVSGDGKLSRAEITRGLRGTVFLVTYSMQQSALVPTDELVAPMAVGALVAQWLAGRIIESFDYDADGLLSIEELFQDRGDLAEVMLALEQLGPAGVATGVDQSRAMLQPVLQMTAEMLGLFRR